MIITDEMKKEEITRLDLLPLSFLNESPFTGSKRGIRFRLEKVDVAKDENACVKVDNNDSDSSRKKEFVTGEKGDQSTLGAVLRCYVWHGKMAFKNTPPEQIKAKDVDFSDAGIDDAIRYLNEEALK